MEKITSYLRDMAEVAVSSGPFRTTYPSVLNQWTLGIPPLTSEGRVTLPEIAEIMPYMQQGVAEMRDNVLEGKYTLLVGDDTSGRIPTLILRGVISHVNTCLGRPSVEALFIRGKWGGLASSDAHRLARKVAAAKGSLEEQRALIVTEFMASGGHVKSIGQALHKADMAYDIFAVGRESSEDRYKRNKTLEEDGTIFPQTDYTTKCPRLYQARNVTGYESRYISSTLDKEVVFLPGYKDTFRQARKDIKAAVAQLVNDTLV